MDLYRWAPREALLWLCGLPLSLAGIYTLIAFWETILERDVTWGVPWILKSIKVLVLCLIMYMGKNSKLESISSAEFWWHFLCLSPLFLFFRCLMAFLFLNLCCDLFFFFYLNFYDLFVSGVLNFMMKCLVFWGTSWAFSNYRFIFFNSENFFYYIFYSFPSTIFCWYSLFLKFLFQMTNSSKIHSDFPVFPLLPISI